MNSLCNRLTEIMLAAIIDTGATLDPANPVTVHLATGVMPTGTNPVLADFTEADFDGYEPPALTAWTGPFRRQDGSSYYLSNAAGFEAGTDIESQQITGAWIQSLSSIPLAFVTFDTPVTMNRPGQRLTVEVMLAIAAGDVGMIWQTNSP